MLQAPQQLEAAWQTLHAQQQATLTQLAQWQQRQTLLHKQRQRLLDAYPVGALTLDELLARQNLLDIELQEVANLLAAAPAPESRQLDLETFTQHIQRLLHSADLQLQQEVIHLLIERIVVSDGALIVECVIPTMSYSQLHPVRCET